jgi:hypothetical protein
MNWIISFLVIVVVLSVGFAIIKYLIMPVVPAPAQPVVWAIIGIALLIGLLIMFSQFGGNFGWGHGVTIR